MSKSLPLPVDPLSSAPLASCVNITVPATPAVPVSTTTALRLSAATVSARRPALARVLRLQQVQLTPRRKQGAAVRAAIRIVPAMAAQK
jgi:hypothetical protein